MEDKATYTRNCILDLLENGNLKEGDKLPGARELASEIKVSFAVVQLAIEKLSQDGVLETRPRQGTFVQPNWNERILQNNFTTFNPESKLPWVPGLKEIFKDKLPQIRVDPSFRKSVFELRTTLTVQSESENYLDLREIFDRLYPDKSVFFNHPFKNFFIDGRLPGIPFIFSPRVMFYNPEILEKANCPPPTPNWTWDDFIEKIRLLKKTLPPENILNWTPLAHVWMNLVFRAGGCLLDPESDEPVKIDHPKTQKGLQLFTDLKNELFPEAAKSQDHLGFPRGNIAFQIGPRENLPLFRKHGLSNWKNVPLPFIDGGEDISAQATDLICIRKSCADNQLAEKFVELMLSEEVQDFIAAEKYGIPIRKSSAMKSIDLDNPNDAIFLTEGYKIRSDYNIYSSDLSILIRDGLTQIWENGKDVKSTTEELANAVRIFFRIKKQKAENQKLSAMEAI
jgi:ABC-type glycerol-3-phosphate transport system substrate-binding protein